MRVSLYALLLFGLLPVSAFAETSCSLGDARRRVGVVTTAGDGSIPCAVRYIKEPEGHDDLRWHASNGREFCEQSAEELVRVLGDAGWICDSPPARSPVTAAPSPPAARPPSVSAFPVAEIEEPPPLVETRPATLRERLVADPRLRFYRSSFGEEALRAALRIAPIDLNDDGREELFLQVELPALCRDGLCTWDLFQIGPEGGLATLGVRQVVEWRTLPERREGFPDLAVRFPTSAATGEAEYALFHFALGMYRRVDDAAPSDLFGSEAARWVPGTPAAVMAAP